MLFISPQKLFSFSKYLRFFLDFLILNFDLIKKIGVNFKFYDVTAWLTNILANITHITQFTQYFEN